MLVAQKKQEENIAEYVLYLFQIEDIVRSLNFDIEKIMESVVKPNLPDTSFEAQYRSWYEEIIREMKRSSLEKKGHLDRVMEVMKELLFLHNTLFAIQGESKYKQLCTNSSSFIGEFREKASMKNQHDVEILIHAMHMKLQFRLRKKEITQETEEALDTMRIQLAFLVREYHKMKSGDYSSMQN
jgi:ABC-type oligopeptide transport system ATPase subunit